MLLQLLLGPTKHLLVCNSAPTVLLKLSSHLKLPGCASLKHTQAFGLASSGDGAVVVRGRQISTGTQQQKQQQQAPERDNQHIAAGSSTASTHEAAGRTPDSSVQQHAPAGTSSGSGSSTEPSVLQRYITQKLVPEVSGAINRLTGYEGIDALKGRVADVDAALTRAKRELRDAKADYDQQLAKQTQLHREVTALLQRKSSWVPADVTRFTQLYADEHATEAAVAAAKARYGALGDDVDGLQLRLVDLIRERYQQEQLWSDKIRRASTWWTWGLMGLHFASFMAVYTLIEPRKRRAMTASVAAMLQQHTADLDDRLAQLAAAVGARPGGQSRSSQKQQQQQQVPGGDAGPELQQQVLAELHKVQQQLQAMQQQHSAAAAAAAAAAPSSPSPAAAAGAGPARGGWGWALPGSGWAASQLAAAAQRARAGWGVAQQKAGEVAAHFGVLGELSQLQPRGSGQEASHHHHQQQQRLGGAAGVAAAGGAGHQAGRQQEGANGGPAGAPTQPTQQQEATAAAQEQQRRPTPAGPADAMQQPQQQQGAEKGPLRSAAAAAGRAGGDGSSSSSSLSCLLQQLWGGSSVVEVTRGQLALLAAAASAAGAGLGAAVLLLLLAGSRPGGGGRGGSYS